MLTSGDGLDDILFWLLENSVAMARKTTNHSRSFYIEALKSRGTKGRLSKMKKAELVAMYHKTTPGAAEDHDGPKTDHDVQTGDGSGLSLAPDPREMKGGHFFETSGTMKQDPKVQHTHEKTSMPARRTARLAPRQSGQGHAQEGEGHEDQHGQGHGDQHGKGHGDQQHGQGMSYRAFVAAEMKKNKGNLREAAAAWKKHKASQKGGHYIDKGGKASETKDNKGREGGYEHTHPGSNPATGRASAPAPAPAPSPAPSSPTSPTLAIADKDASDPIPEDDQDGAGILSSLEAAGREAKGLMERHPYVKDAAEGALALGGLVATGGLAAPEEAAAFAAEEGGSAAAEAGGDVAEDATVMRPSAPPYGDWAEPRPSAPPADEVPRGPFSQDPALPAPSDADPIPEDPAPQELPQAPPRAGPSSLRPDSLPRVPRSVLDPGVRDAGQLVTRGAARDAGEVASRDVGTLATRTPGVEDNIPDPIPEDDDPIPEEPTSAAQEPEPTESTENWRRATGPAPGGMSGVRAAARAARAADAASEGLGRAAGAAGRAARAVADEFGNMAGRATQGFREEAGRAAEEAGRRAGSAGGVLRDVGKFAPACSVADRPVFCPAAPRHHWPRVGQPPARARGAGRWAAHRRHGCRRPQRVVRRPRLRVGAGGSRAGGVAGGACAVAEPEQQRAQQRAHQGRRWGGDGVAGHSAATGRGWGAAVPVEGGREDRSPAGGGPVGQPVVREPGGADGVRGRGSVRCARQLCRRQLHVRGRL
eukprot:COSAG02_NODE_360_length_23829_cov_107.112769_3_plen_762_part_00